MKAASLTGENMTLYFFGIFLAVGANVFYHLCQKSIRVEAHPIVSLLGTYLVAIAATLIILPFLSLKGGLVGQFRQLNWASYILGLAIFGLEMGFLLAYRVGWSLSTAALYSNVCVGLILIPIGLLFFSEHLNYSNMIGLVLAFISVYLLSQ